MLVLNSLLHLRKLRRELGTIRAELVQLSQTCAFNRQTNDCLYNDNYQRLSQEQHCGFRKFGSGG